MADDLKFTISADNAQALQAVNQLATAMQQLVGQVQASAGASNNAASAVNNMAAGMQRSVMVGSALGAAIGTIAGQYLPQIVSGLVSWGKEAILAAAQTETLTGVAQFLGTGVGKSKDEINALIKALNQQGITVQESANLVSMLIRTNIDLEHATRLAAVAQNIAAQSGKISSEVLNGLITAVVKLSPQMLDQYGIIVKNSEAQEAYAKVLGKSADELNGAERQMALLNAVFEQGDRVAGVYGVAMGFASKQMGSLTRFVQDAQNELGSHFLPALRLVISGLTELFKAVRESPELFLALGAAIGVAGGAAALAAGGGFLALTGGTGALILALGSLIGLIPALLGRLKEMTGDYKNARDAIDAGEDALWGYATAIERGKELTREDVDELQKFIAANVNAKGETAQLVAVLEQLINRHERSLGPVDRHTQALRQWNEEVAKWRATGGQGAMPRLDLPPGALLPPGAPQIRVAPPRETSALDHLAKLQAAYNEQIRQGGSYLITLTRNMDKYGLSAKEVAAAVNEKLGAEIVSAETVTRLAKEQDAGTKAAEKAADAAKKLREEVEKLAQAETELIPKHLQQATQFGRSREMMLVAALNGIVMEETAYIRSVDAKLAADAEWRRERNAEGLKQMAADAKQLDASAKAHRDYLNWIGEREIEHAERLKAFKEETDRGYRALQNELGEMALERERQRQEATGELARTTYEIMKRDGISTAAQIQAAWEEWFEKDYANRHAWLTSWQQTLGTLSEAFAQLAQVSGGTFGGIVQDIAVVINALNVGVEGTKTFSKGMAQIRDGSISQGLANIAAGAMSIAAGFMQATEAGGTFAKTAKGALYGAQIGAQFGGAFGAAVGAAIGATAGLLRGMFGGPSKQELAGREAAANFTKGLEEGLTKVQKAEILAVTATGASRKWATQMVAVRDAYIAAGKSIAEAEDVVNRLWRAEKEGPEAVKRVLTEINAVLDAHKEQLRNAEEFASTFSDMLGELAKSGELASQQVLDLINKVREAGAVSSEVSEFVRGQVERAGRGLVTYLTTTERAFKTLEEKERAFRELDREYQDKLHRGFFEADKEGPQERELRRRWQQLKAEVDEARRAVELTAVTTQSAATGMAAAIVATFGELQRQGVSVTDAMKQLEPAILALDAQMQRAGLTGNAAFQQIRDMAALATDEVAGPALDAVAGLNETLIGLHNSGLLNQEMFAGLTEQIGTTFERLVAQGFNGDAAMRMMQPTLQTVWELMEDFGLETDEATKKLVAQAVEAGIVGEKHRDVNDRIAKSLDKLITLLEDFIKVLGIDVPDAATTAADSVNAAEEQIEPWDSPTMFWPEDVPDDLADTLAAIGEAGDRMPHWEEPWAHWGEPPSYEPGAGGSPRSDYDKDSGTTREERTIDGHYYTPAEYREKFGFQHGTPDLQYVDFAGGTRVKLHGLEKVVPKSRELEDFVRTAMRLRGSTLVPPAGGRAADPLLEELRALRRELRMHSGPSAVVIPVSIGGQKLEEKVVDISQRALNDRRLVTRADAVRQRR